MTRTFTLRFEMLSDWHVGAGVGRPGSVDRLLARDAAGLPFLPAKTVRGMWRDAAERLAGALGDDWAAVVDAVFGDQPAQTRAAREARPRPTALFVTPARLPAKLRARLAAGSPALRAAVAFVKPGVMLDPATGRAKDDCLRFEEVARAGAVLTATVTFDPDLAGYPAAEPLLLAATRLITRVGGKRRRGNGRCVVTVVGADVDAATDLLEAASPAVGVGAGPNTMASTPPAPSAGDGWVEFPFALDLRGPVAVAARTVGNVVESLDFIPGTYLLAHLTRAFPALRPAVARGDVMVTNATRDVGGAAGRPVPFALFAPKGKGFADRDELVNRLTASAAGAAQLKQLRGGYVGPCGDDLESKTVRMTVRTHNVIADGPQRPTTEVGGVYSYEAIAPAVFRGSILARTGLLTDAGKLTGPVRLGSSKKDDYGEAVLTVAGVTDTPNPRACAGELVVWLLSDVLLRDAALRPAPTVAALQHELATRLRVGLTAAGVFARQRRTESWHTGWGLPRPSLVGLQAGTCVRFTVQGETSAAVLAAVAAAGIGERTAEGYGRVAFNHPLLTTPPRDWTNAGLAAVGGAPAAVPAADDPEPAAEYVAVIEAAERKAAVRTAALHATDTAEKRKTLFGWEIPGPGRSKPTLSQLGGLRAVLSFLHTPATTSSVTGWLDAVTANPRRKETWPDGALALTRRWFADPAAVWTALGVGAPADLWAFAVRALLDAGIRAHKRETEPPAKR